VTKLRVIFENATSEIELWSKGATAQVDSQLRERRRNFRRRREALERIQSAAGELETRIAELQMQDDRLHQYLARVGELTTALRAESDSDSDLDQSDAVLPVDNDGLLHIDLPLEDEPVPLLMRHHG
jgi:hypothetical protein